MCMLCSLCPHLTYGEIELVLDIIDLYRLQSSSTVLLRIPYTCPSIDLKSRLRTPNRSSREDGRFVPFGTYTTGLSDTSVEDNNKGLFKKGSRPSKASYLSHEHHLRRLSSSAPVKQIRDVDVDNGQKRRFSI